MTIAELLKARTAAFDALQKLVDKLGAADYDETAEDNKLYDELKTKVANLDAKIARQTELNGLRAAAAVAVPGQEGDARRNDDGPRIQRVRYAPVRNFKGADAEEQAFRFGRFMQASIFGDHVPKAAVQCAELGIPLVKAASEGVNSAGGFLVPGEFENAIIDLRDEYGLFRRLTRVIPMGRDMITIPRRVSGLTAYAVGEGVAATQSQMVWDVVNLVAKKWSALTLLSSELDEDAAVNIGDMLIEELAYAFAVAEDTAGFNGDGSSTYNGITGIVTKLQLGSATYAGAIDAASGHDTMAEIDSGDLTNVMAKLPNYVYQRGRVAWHCTQTAWAAIFQRLLMGLGGATIEIINGRIQRSYLGFPIEINTSMTTTTTAINGTAMLLFGDASQAVAFGARRGFTVARSTEYKFAEDQIAIKATQRHDINVHDLGTSSAAGPMVALLGKT